MSGSSMLAIDEPLIDVKIITPPNATNAIAIRLPNIRAATGTKSESPPHIRNRKQTPIPPNTNPNTAPTNRNGPGGSGNEIRREGGRGGGLLVMRETIPAD